MNSIFKMIALSILCSLGASCASQKAPSPSSTTPQTTTAPMAAATKPDPAGEPILPLSTPGNVAQALLGERLFNDKRLSHDDTVSCASCHGLDKGGTDLLPVSVGINGTKGPINAPTVFNSGLNLAQFWDGRAKNLAEQAAGPVNNPKEMGSNWEEVLGKLNADVVFATEFKKIYPDGFNAANITNAIAAFEDTLITANSRFDKWLKGDATALTQVEREGYALFKGKGCTTCHNGANVGGTSFQKLGVMKDYFADRGTPLTDADMGRYNVTKDDLDKHFFKVPSLRVAALTPPYFHDASQPTLEAAIKTMGTYQLGVTLSDDEISKIAAFLKSLVGEYQGHSLIK